MVDDRQVKRPGRACLARREHRQMAARIMTTTDMRPTEAGVSKMMFFFFFGCPVLLRSVWNIPVRPATAPADIFAWLSMAIPILVGAA